MITHEFTYRLGDKVELRTGAIGFIHSASINRDNEELYFVETKYNETWQNPKNIVKLINKGDSKTEINIPDLSFNQKVQTRSDITGLVTSASIAEHTNRVTVCVKGKDAFRWENLSDIHIV